MELVTDNLFSSKKKNNNHKYGRLLGKGNVNALFRRLEMNTDGVAGCLRKNIQGTYYIL